MTICIFMYIFPQKHIFLYFLQFRVHVSLLMQMGWVSLRANHSPVELHIISCALWQLQSSVCFRLEGEGTHLIDAVALGCSPE